MRNTVLAVDAGRGNTKAVWGSKQACWQSVVGRVVKTKGLAHDNGVVDVVRGDLAFKAMVGREAALSSDTAQQGLASLRSRRDITALVAEALWLSGLQDKDILLVTGAPEATYHTASQDYKSWFTGDWVVNGQGYNVAETLVVTEPTGTVASQAMDVYGNVVDEALLKSNVAVLDIGQHSIDGTAFYYDATRGAPIRSENESFGIDRGSMAYVQGDVQEWLLGTHRITIPLHRLFAPIETGTITLDGRAISLRKVIDASVISWASYIMDVLREKWELYDIDHYFLAGGGAKLFIEPLQAWRSSMRVVDEPVMSNVRGFCAIGNRYVKAMA